ncbi:MAG TPA: indolepyruvate oxidoreductase subunit beta family protein, partial [Solirubrobacteraceae bacterium]|nr:indolepyruvate oxidoreductase subunit beta family protein [Solirubrobacteraceae bacterium]
MSSWSEGRRPVTLAILALGGEGGGVLADWVVAAAEGAGYRAQNTSVAGVAQRTGATVYYVELFPPAAAGAESASGNGSGSVRDEPIMSIFPTPGEVDIVITSELMECGRAVQRGFTTPDRTTLITSTNRVYSIDEKMALGDGRVDDEELLAAAQRASKRLIAADFAQIAESADSVISASLLGALAGSGALALTREQFEAPIRAFGRSVEPSLAAFAGGFDASAAPLLSVTQQTGNGRTPESTKAGAERRRNEIAATDPATLVGPELRELAQRTRAMPAAARSMILHGLVRTGVFQDLPYAERYLARVARFADVEPDADGAARLTVEAARHIALWMCYQDTIHVALQKTRRARMQRVRAEAKATRNQLVEVREFLHPQIDEITDTLPTALGATLRRSKSFQRLVHRVTHKGMVLNTTSLTGYTLLTAMARCRPLRPRSLRFGREQAAIEQWMAQALD